MSARPTLRPPHPPPLLCFARTGNPTQQHITYVFRQLPVRATTQVENNDVSPSLPVRATPQAIQEQLGPKHPPTLHCVACTSNRTKQHITHVLTTFARTGNAMHRQHANNSPTLPVRATHCNPSTLKLSMTCPYGHRSALRTPM